MFEEVHQAPAAEVLRGDLERRGLHVFEVRPRGAFRRLPKSSAGRGARPIPLRDLLIFNQELAALLRSGLPLLQALELMLERMSQPDLKRVLTQVRDRVKSGSELSDAFAEFSAQLPSLYPSTLKAGERSGELEAVIRRFIRYQRLVMDARKRVVSALVYPAVLIGLAMVMVLVMTVYVVPRFTVFYTELGSELPLLTRVTLGVSLFLRDRWLLIVGGIAVATFLFRRWRQTPAGQVAIDRFKMRLPLVGSIFHRLAMAEFCRALSTLLAGGIPLLSALETGVGAVGNSYMRQALSSTVGRVREGSSFHAALQETGEAHDIVVDMVKVGEATGALDTMLANVSDFFDEETETQMQRILGLLEPILLVLMGGIIATLLLSVYMPLFGALGQLPA